MGRDGKDEEGVSWMDILEIYARFVQKVSEVLLASNPLTDIIGHVDESHTVS